MKKSLLTLVAVLLLGSVNSCSDSSAQGTKLTDMTVKDIQNMKASDLASLKTLLGGGCCCCCGGDGAHGGSASLTGKSGTNPTTVITTTSVTGSGPYPTSSALIQIHIDPSHNGGNVNPVLIHFSFSGTLSPAPNLVLYSGTTGTGTTLATLSSGTDYMLTQVTYNTYGADFVLKVNNSTGSLMPLTTNSSTSYDGYVGFGSNSMAFIYVVEP